MGSASLGSVGYQPSRNPSTHEFTTPWLHVPYLPFFGHYSSQYPDVAIRIHPHPYHSCTKTSRLDVSGNIGSSLSLVNSGVPSSSLLTCFTLREEPLHMFLSNVVLSISVLTLALSCPGSKKTQ